MQNENAPQGSPQRSNTTVIALISVAIVLLIAILGLMAYNILKNDEPQQPVTEVAQPAPQPAVSEPSQPEPAASPVEQQPQGVNGEVNGMAGGMHVSLYMNGSAGYYDTSGGRRTLKLVSRNGDRVVINAYLKGRYIGKFDGTISTSGGQLSSYSGKFYSSRGGAGLSFDLINPMD